MAHFAGLKTNGGYLCGEVASAMQKAIRRGEETAALFWATELDLAGFGNYVFKRLRIIASEDVGLADPYMPATIRALYDSWQELTKEYKGKPRQPARMFLTHAVLLLVRAKKSRIVDHALITFYKGDRTKMKMVIPDEALDQHTGKGKQKGRGVAHFFDEAAKLENAADLPDTYRATARLALENVVEGNFELAAE
jgi:replication-associated recombination protein RarA